MTQRAFIEEIINIGTLQYLLTFETEPQLNKEFYKLGTDDTYTDFSNILTLMREFLAKKHESIAKYKAELKAAHTPEECQSYMLDIDYNESFRDMAIEVIDKIEQYIANIESNKIT